MPVCNQLSLWSLRLLLAAVLAATPVFCQADGSPETSDMPAADPEVSIAMLVRNKAYALPYSLAGIERFNYNLSRVSLLFYVDHTRDQGWQLLQTWRTANYHRFARIVIRVSEKPVDYDGEVWSLDWTEERFRHVMKIRQLALESARSYGSKFVFYLDADVLITHPDALRHLTSRNLSLLAPLLNCSTDPSYGANFWGNIDPHTGYYLRSDGYLDIQQRTRVGLFPVAVVHSAFLLSLQETNVGAQFQFDPVPEGYPTNWPVDDLPMMHWAAIIAGVQPVLDNSLQFGVYATFEDRRLLSNSGFSVLDLDAGAFKHALMEFHYHHAGLDAWQPAASLAKYAAPPTPPRKLAFDLIFVINLARRPDRLERMRYSLNLLGLDWQHLEAVDGRKLNSTFLMQKGIKSLSGYTDPYHGRGLTMGEVGCFLSHHAVWQAVANDPTLNRVLVLEDDVRFGPNFEERLVLTTGEASRLRPDWELLYIGRKIMHSEQEKPLPGSKLLTYPSYTYWTLGYAITKAGARKLINQKPLDRLIAVDEYLPVMFDQHPNNKWKAAFEPRNLVALSAAPLLLQPNYYIGMSHYVSDTEGSSELAANRGVCEDGKDCSTDGKPTDAYPADRYSTIRN